MQYLYLKKDILLQNFIDFYIVNIYNITQQFDIYYVKILLDTVKLMRPKLVLREIATQFRRELKFAEVQAENTARAPREP